MPKVRRCKHLGCHQLVQYPGYYCANHSDDKSNRSMSNHIYNVATRKRNRSKIEQYKFYRSREWKSIRESVLVRDTYLCQYCFTIGVITSGNIVDHIVPYEYYPDGKADKSNLVTCCKACHNAKTKWEHEYYGTGLENEKKEVARLTNLELLSKLIESHKKPVERF